MRLSIATQTAAVTICLLQKPVLSNTLKYQSALSGVLANYASNSTASGSVNIVPGSGEYVDQSLQVAYFPYLIRFTCNDVPVNALGYYDGVASISLAMEHLNTGNGSIVPEVDGINQKCPLRFAMKSFDTECQQIVAVDHVISLTDRNRAEQLIPMAILGASWSSISMPTSIISGLRDVPQVSPGSTSSALDDKGQYKLFGRTVPNDDGTAIPLLAKLNQWGVNHLAVLYVDDSYGNAFMEGIIAAAQTDTPNVKIQTVSIVPNPDAATIESVGAEVGKD